MITLTASWKNGLQNRLKSIKKNTDKISFDVFAIFASLAFEMCNMLCCVLWTKTPPPCKIFHFTKWIINKWQPLCIIQHRIHRAQWAKFIAQIEYSVVALLIRFYSILSIFYSFLSASDTPPFVIWINLRMKTQSNANHFRQSPTNYIISCTTWLFRKFYEEQKCTWFSFSFCLFIYLPRCRINTERETHWLMSKFIRHN